MLCKEDPEESLSKRRMLEIKLIATSVMGNQNTKKIIQVFQPIIEFTLLLAFQELKLGVLQHQLTLMPGRYHSKEMMR